MNAALGRSGIPDRRRSLGEEARPAIASLRHLGRNILLDLATHMLKTRLKRSALKLKRALRRLARSALGSKRSLQRLNIHHVTFPRKIVCLMNQFGLRILASGVRYSQQ